MTDDAKTEVERSRELEPATAGPPGSRKGPIHTAISRIRELLTPGEEIEALAIQRQYVYLWLRRRMIVAATPARLIAMRRRIVGGFDILDVRWQDLQDARIEEGIFGSTLTITVRDRANHAMLVMDQGGTGMFAVSRLQKT